MFILAPVDSRNVNCNIVLCAVTTDYVITGKRTCHFLFMAHRSVKIKIKQTKREIFQINKYIKFS